MTTSVKLNDTRDLLYVRLREGRAAITKEFGDHRLVDLDQDGQVLGVEFIGIERQIDLRGLPEHRRIHDALIAGAPSDLMILTDPFEEGGSVAAATGMNQFLRGRPPATVQTTSQEAAVDVGRASGVTELTTPR